MAIHFIEPLHLKHPENKNPKPRFEPRLEDLEKTNYSFGCITLDTDSVAGKTIATLPIDSFLPSTEKSVEIWKEIRAGIGEKLSSIADADALIVDLRENHGGDPSTCFHHVISVARWVTPSTRLHRSIRRSPAVILYSSHRRASSRHKSIWWNKATFRPD